MFIIFIIQSQIKKQIIINMYTKQIISFVVTISVTIFLVHTLAHTASKQDTCDEELFPNLCICDVNYCDENIKCCYEELSNTMICFIGIVIGSLSYLIMLDCEDYHKANDSHVF